METLTEEMIRNISIPTPTIIQDITDTQREIDSYESELTPLRNNPVENKLAIYLREGKILQRKDFIEKLEQILTYRNNDKENYNKA
jgi:hypothetical protein